MIDGEARAAAPRPGPLRSLVGAARIEQGDSAQWHRHSRLFRVIAPAQRQLVAASAQDHGLPPAEHQAFLREKDMAGLDRVERCGPLTDDWCGAVLSGFALGVQGGHHLRVHIFTDLRDGVGARRVDPSFGQLRNEVGRDPVADLADVEAELLSGGSRWLGLGLRKPGRVRPALIVDAEHDELRYGQLLNLGRVGPVSYTHLTLPTIY